MLLTMTCLKLSIYTQAQRELDTSMVLETYRLLVYLMLLKSSLMQFFVFYD